MDYLLGAGILRQSQVDGSYDGSPARFVAGRGQDAVQGYATNEPWAWEHEVRQWGRPLAYQLVYDTGYPNYPNVLAIRPSEQDKLDACLHKLVPVIQRAQVEFMTKPDAAVSVILAVDAAYRSGFPYSRPLAENAVRVMRDESIAGNGSNPTLGDFNTGRIARLIQILTPILEGLHKPAKDGLGAVDVATNAYTDPGIGLPDK